MSRGVQIPFDPSSGLGIVASDYWQSYTWKNELATQSERVSQHLAEIFGEIDTEHSPFHMIERAIGIAALCMRRLIECRLVTDKFVASKLAVNVIPRRDNTDWREPFVRHTALHMFDNFDLRRRNLEKISPKQISDKLLHARVVAVLSDSEYLPNGLLVASDIQRKKSVFHFTPGELSSVFEAFLDDRIMSMADGCVEVDGQIQRHRVWAKRE